ncbi:MAG: hypothetical protein J3Q66DRAFT_423772 [Benniella sp.]|nr:MAG: hypothetical protein J3Q66DRAFT_423772 [Benniella sp.]
MPGTYFSLSDSLQSLTLSSPSSPPGPVMTSLRMSQRQTRVPHGLSSPRRSQPETLVSSVLSSSSLSQRQTRVSRVRVHSRFQTRFARSSRNHRLPVPSARVPSNDVIIPRQHERVQLRMFKDISDTFNCACLENHGHHLADFRLLLHACLSRRKKCDTLLPGVDRLQYQRLQDEKDFTFDVTTTLDYTARTYLQVMDLDPCLSDCCALKQEYQKIVDAKLAHRSASTKARTDAERNREDSEPENVRIMALTGFRDCVILPMVDQLGSKDNGPRQFVIATISLYRVIIKGLHSTFYLLERTSVLAKLFLDFDVSILVARTLQMTSVLTSVQSSDGQQSLMDQVSTALKTNQKQVTRKGNRCGVIPSVLYHIDSHT